MGTTFHLTVDTRVQAPDAERSDLVGEDIALGLNGFDETANGDLATVSGLDCTKQSIRREATANPGSFPRRPDWGVGIPGMLFKGVTGATRDRMASKMRARLLANPRVSRVHEVLAEQFGQGTRISYRVDSVGGPIDDVFVVKPPGV